MAANFHIRHLQHRRQPRSFRLHRPGFGSGFGQLQRWWHSGRRWLKPDHWRGRSWRSILLKLGGAGAGLVVLYLLYIWITLPDISDPRSFLASQSTVITDRNGIELYRLFQEEDRTFIDGELIPDHLRHAMVAIEDERYYERGCLDLRAIARVVFRLGQRGGGSTLTRQLARNALNLKRENIYNRKMKEFVLGCQLENQYTKDELLNLYLNWIPFGQNAYGVEQASRAYFGIAARDLTLAQSAVLASLPQRPTYFSPYGRHLHTTVSDETQAAIIAGAVTQASQIGDEDVRIGLLGDHIGTGATVVYVGGRTDQVLQNMEDQGWITQADRLAALTELDTMTFQASRESIRSPHFALWIRQQVEDMFAGTAEEGLLERGGLHIQTTLDWTLQQHAEEVVAFHREDLVTRYGGQNMALMAMTPDTREIVAYVGNMDYSDEEHAGKVDMVQAPRQPGSSFKPFVYAAAFEKGFSPATVLFDVETEIGEDTPQNFDGQFFGPLSIRQALGASRNIPAAKAFFLGGGEERILQLVSSLGAPTPLKRRDELNRSREGGFGYGWPLALGAAETPLLEMVHAYSTFADKGVAKPSVSIKQISDKNGNILFQADTDVQGQQVLDERIAYQVISVLSDESVRPDEYWRTQLTVPGFQTAAKTGTSNKCLENKPDGSCRLRKPDNAWLVGFTPELVAGVWVGNADSTAMFDKAGGLNTASPIWRDFMMRAHRDLSITKTTFPVPEGIVQPQVSLLSGKLPTECTPVELRRADVFLEEFGPSGTDDACAQLRVDRVTGLLASDTCPADAQEDGSFYVANSVLPQRWPKWEEAVQLWMTEQMELWNATPDHSGSLLKLPQAPTEVCDPSDTPGRLIEPTVQIVTPKDGGTAPYPAFGVQLDYDVGSTVQEVKFLLDGKRVALETEPPFAPTVRIPRSIKREGTHRLEVQLVDEYFNIATDAITLRFGVDTEAPVVRLRRPVDQSSHAVGSRLRLRADATDDEGGVKYVQFYLGDTLLSTKPKPPYELDYTLDLDPGQYTVRAVAEDMAEHTSEDSVTIVVTDEAVPLPDVPHITEPTALELFLVPDELLDVSVITPTIGGDIFEVRLVVQHALDGDEDVLLALTEGEGEYHRTWQAPQPGTYLLELIVVDRNRQPQVVDGISIEVE